MPALLEPDTEILPGYRLMEPLGRGGCGEVWKCEAPGGFFKALKIVPGGEQLDEGGGVFAQERKALDYIKTIRHPFLLSMDRVELVEGDLIIVMELADKSLRRVLKEYREAGRPGIPREELLGYLLEAAEALDLMNLQHQLLHLDIKPDNLFVVCHHVKVADFGLVKRTTSSGHGQSAGITALYAAPERFQGTVSPSCDQYSLAMVYQELLTGTLPFSGQNWRQLLLQHCHEPPDLSALPEEDRPVIARALSKEPGERFDSCTDLAQALVTGSVEARAGQARKAGSSRFGNLRPPAGGGTRNLRLPGDQPESGPRVQEKTWDGPADQRPGLPAKAAGGSKEPLQGYRFLDRLGQGPCGEYWRAHAPGGQLRLVQLVYGYAFRTPEEEMASLRKLKVLRHTGLTKFEVVRDAPGRFFLITDLPETTLWDRFQKCRGEGLAGIPRQELLDHLYTAAETLDDLAEDHQLYHLGLTTGAFVLVKEQLRIADFGLIHLFWGPGEQPLGPLNARYAAPELFREPPHRSCDVYSLALLYQELLSGVHPQRGQSVRPSNTGRRPARLDLGALPEADRVTLTRALESDPGKRFESCVALIEALKGRPSSSATRPVSDLLSVPATPVPCEPPRRLSESALVFPPLGPVLAELVAAAAGPVQVHEKGNFRYLLYPGSRLVHTCAAALPADLARLKLEGFRQEWNAQVIDDRHGRFVLFLPAGRSFWQRCLGREPGLEVEVRLHRGEQGGALTKVSVEVKPLRCGKDEGVRLLQESGPILLASLRTYLQPYRERRAQARLPFEQTLEVRPVLLGRHLGEALAGLSKDISSDGMRLWVPQAWDASHACIQFPRLTQPGVVPALAQVCNVQPAHDGGCEIGVRFEEGQP